MNFRTPGLGILPRKGHLICKQSAQNACSIILPRQVALPGTISERLNLGSSQGYDFFLRLEYLTWVLAHTPSLLF